MSFDWFVALRYLRSKRKEGFVSVIAGFSFVGIALGVATLIIVMSVMNGFREELFKRIVGIKGHVLIHNRECDIDNHEAITKLVKSNPEVSDAIPLIEQQAVLFFKTKAHGVILKGMKKEDFLNRKLVSDSVSKNALNRFNGNVILLGRRLVEKMGIRNGETVSVMVPNGQQTMFGTLPKQKAFKFIGDFQIGMHEYDKGLAFVPIDEMQKLFKMGNSVNFIEIFLKNPSNSSILSDAIQQSLGINYSALDWKHGDSQIFHAVQVERNVMFIILMLIVVIAAFNVISGLIMLVKDKTKDIAILRTIGASQKSILKIFIITGSFIGFIGTLLGLFIGLMFSLNIENIRQFFQKLLKTDLFSSEIYFLSQLPSKIDYSEVALIVSISLILSFLATMYPSWRACKTNPVEGLRYY